MPRPVPGPETTGRGIAAGRGIVSRKPRGVRSPVCSDRQYVAIHEGQVVESGSDKLEVARRAYSRFGYVPIFVSRVTDEPIAPVRVPSPRLPTAGTRS
ncbi:MAG TPA: hypothetical protein VKF17_19195 [Isosphaeraceae bacterium]|nr:hypothetical protein [Isosphaeraceae bacterium]